MEMTGKQFPELCSLRIEECFISSSDVSLRRITY